MSKYPKFSKEHIELLKDYKRTCELRMDRMEAQAITMGTTVPLLYYELKERMEYAVKEIERLSNED